MVPLVLLYLIRPDPRRVGLPTVRFLLEGAGEEATHPLLERLRRSLLLLLQVLVVVAAMEAIDGVLDVHHVHVRALDPRRSACSAHLDVEEGTDRDAVLASCRGTLAERFGIDHATVQVGSPGFAETVGLE